MTASEVRAIVRTYYLLSSSGDEDLPPPGQGILADYRRWANDVCDLIVSKSSPGRWAKRTVGPVLASGMGAAAFMRDSVPNPGAALRVFGLSGSAALSNSAAWELVKPYALEPKLSPEIVDGIRRKTALRIQLPMDPTPADMLTELTRPRSGDFAVQMSRWISDHFRKLGEQSPENYGNYYRDVLRGLVDLNERSELIQFTGRAPQQEMTHSDWEALAHGRLPHERLEARAGVITTRKFVVDYWQRWQDTTRGAVCGKAESKL